MSLGPNTGMRVTPVKNTLALARRFPRVGERTEEISPRYCDATRQTERRKRSPVVLAA